MGIKFGNTDISKIYIGQTVVTPPTSYRYIKWYIASNKGASVTQMSEFEICDTNGTKMSRPAGTSITATREGHSGEGIDKLIDGSISTKYCTPYAPPITITIDLGTTVDFTTYNKYKRYTANDAYQRDPITWTISLSNDGSNWTEVSNISNATITTSRNTLAGTWDITIPTPSPYKKIRKIFLGSTQVRPSKKWHPTANTIAYYPLRSDVNDASTNHNDLTVQGTVTYTQVGGATINTCHFTGGANYLYINNATGIPQGISPSTWSIRVYITQNQTSGHDGTLFAFGKNGTSNALRTLFYEGGSTNIGISQRGSASSRYTLSLNTWYNLVVTYDGSAFRMYVNGNTTPVVTWNKSINTDGNNIWIMGQTRDNNYGVVGNAGDAILENKTRTAQEISDYYNQTKANYGIS